MLLIGTTVADLEPPLKVIPVNKYITYDDRQAYREICGVIIIWLALAFDINSEAYLFLVAIYDRERMFNKYQQET